MENYQVREIIVKILNEDFSEIHFQTDADNLIERGLDSIKTIQLILKIEYAFDFEFANEDLLLTNFSTIENIIQMVALYLKK